MSDGYWLSIEEYGRYRNLSVSTVRRYIKANRVKHKLYNKKYLIYVSFDNFNRKLTPQQQLIEKDHENTELKSTVIKLQEELEDLKMLISIYENNKNDTKNETSI